MALPELYKQGRLGKYFGFKQYCYFVFEGVLQVRSSLRSTGSVPAL